MSAVIDNPGKHRFELALGDALAIAEYRVEDGKLVLTHTEVPEELSGQGVGSKLAKGVFEAIRASGRKVVPRCPFMAAFVDRHPEYADLTAG